MSFKKNSIILCTYNESNYVKETVEKLQHGIENLELIVVDDDSSDETRNIINDSNKDNKIKLIHRKKTRGLASAFMTGLMHCTGDKIGWIDCNMSELIHKFKEMEASLESGHDIAILSRYIDGGGDKRKPLRALSSKYLNLICRFFLGSKIKDYTSGIFLMKRKILYKVAFLPYRHGEFFIEFIENVIRKEFKVQEIPYVQMKDDDLVASKTAGSFIRFFYLGFIYFLRILKTVLRKG